MAGYAHAFGATEVEGSPEPESFEVTRVTDQKWDSSLSKPSTIIDFQDLDAATREAWWTITPAPETLTEMSRRSAECQPEPYCSPDTTRPCCVDVRHDPSFGEETQVCRATPYPGLLLSNPSTNRATYYVNGMNQSLSTIAGDVQALTALTGGEVKAILNDNSKSFFEEVKSAFFGFLSPVFGFLTEPKAVTDTMNAVMGDVERGERVRLFAFSQGAIIVSNALELLQARLPEDKWQQVAENVEVITAGAGTALFPEGIQVHGLVHSRDPVPRLAGMFAPARIFASTLLMPLTGLKQVPMQRGTATEIDGAGIGDAHNFSAYLKNTPVFLIAAHTVDDRVDGAGLAHALAGIIQDGAFADHVVHSIIEIMAEGHNEEFFETLRQYAPGGRIGNFVVPQLLKEEWDFAKAA